MVTRINPKLPMRDKNVTLDFYTDKLGFKVVGNIDFWAKHLRVRGYKSFYIFVK
jgi:catechol 2,3-dioxygenase-like lactoylglutathione lyase family enzyme